MPSTVLPGHLTVRQRYDHLVDTGVLTVSTEQQHIADLLDGLMERLLEKRLQRKSSALGWMFAKRKAKPEPVRGFYLHGGVGRGKTMLMDMFFDLVTIRRKRRAHFNDFMADIHDRIGRHRAALKAGTVKGDDPIPPVADAVAEESWLICFDEFTVTDIADAMILSRLFSALFDRGVVLVATSNVAPQNLYKDGLNRSLFTPFIGILERHTDVVDVDIDTDYRLRAMDRLPVYVIGSPAETRPAMDEAWDRLITGAEERPVTIEVKGRTILVERAAGRSARFSFADLCARPLGARDYLAIVGRFDRIMIDGVPVMGMERRNEAKRFILLVDTLYDQHIHLILSAEAGPTALYTGTSGTERFEFDRTASRLIEMQSAEWLETARDCAV
ncbi:MAG: AFG1 family ATPase [Notoacmeibacter sp.]|nr:AFG1 family ATPase [Notoacmeibacter sp.]